MADKVQAMCSLVPGSGHLDDEVDSGDVEGSDRSLRQTNTPGQMILKGNIINLPLN